MRRGKADQASLARFLFDALENARALARKSLVGEHRVGFGGRDVGRVVEQASEAGATFLANATRPEMLPFGRSRRVSQTDVNEPIVGQVRMPHALLSLVFQ